MILTADRNAQSGAPAKDIDFIRLFGQLKGRDWAFADKQKIARRLRCHIVRLAVLLRE
jgi:hypothetical protein